MPRKDYSTDPRLEGVARWLFKRIMKEREVYFKEHEIIPVPFQHMDGEFKASWYHEAEELLRTVDSSG